MAEMQQIPSTIVIQPIPPPMVPPPGGQTQFMPAPVAPPPFDCPSGLEYLTQVDQLLVQQQVEWVEALTGFETNNKYQVKNAVGQIVYFAAEENDFCTRNIFGPVRPFQIKIVDNFGKPIILLDRPLRCQACCFPCCLQIMHVYAPMDTLIGIIKQQWSFCTPLFEICDANGDPVLEIRGPCIPCRCCSDVKFDVFGLDGETKVGCISKQWSGFLKEALTDADNFGVTFPIDMDVKVKATLFAATFLIDFMFFEENDQRNH